MPPFQTRGPSLQRTGSRAGVDLAGRDSRGGFPPKAAAGGALGGSQELEGLGHRAHHIDVIVRPARPSDESFIGELAGQVFSVFGNYQPLLPKWFKAPGIVTYISELDQGRTGYLMLGFFRDARALVGDVLAIAVAPEYQGRGIGRMLLEHAIAACERASEHSPVRAIRLSVADSNARARHLFASCGFALVPGDFGSYEGGQEALHMERPIPLPGG